MASKTLYIWYNDHRHFHRSFMFFILFLPLVTFKHHLRSNFTERPWGIATSPQSLFYMSIFSYFVLTDCDQLLTSFQEGPYHTYLVFDWVMRAKIEILVCISGLPVDALLDRGHRCAFFPTECLGTAAYQKSAHSQSDEL